MSEKRSPWQKTSRKEKQSDLGIYSSDARESMLDDGELSPMEDAFMQGYEEEVV